MNELIIINCRLNKNSLYEIKNLKKNSITYCINFVENYDIDNQFVNLIKINNTVDFQLFCKKEFKNIFGNLKRKRISDEFWKMKSSEFNFADYFWIDLLKKKYLLEIIKIKKIKKIKFYTDIQDYSFNKMIREIEISEVKFINKNVFKKKYFFNKFYYLSIYYIKIKNFYKEIKNISLINSIGEKNSKKFKNIFIANYPDHFTKKFKINYNKNNNKFFYYISLIRNNSNSMNFPKKISFNKLRNKKNFDYIERGISLKNIIKFYISNNFSLRKKIDRDLEIIGFDKHQSKVLNYYYRQVELPKLQIYDLAIRNLLNKIKFKNINYGYFEFIEGRIITQALNSNRIKYSSYQHGIMGFFQKIRCIEVLNVMKKIFIPRRVVLMQNNFRNNILNKIKNSKFLINNNYSKISNKMFNYESEINILIFSDLHGLKYYDSFLKSTKVKKNLKIFFRPHPKNKNHYKKFFRENKFENIFIDDEDNYKNSLKKFKINLILSSTYTGMLNEIKNLYWPILILNFKHQVPNIEYNKQFEKEFVINSISDVNFKKYYTNKMRQKFINKLNN